MMQTCFVTQGENDMYTLYRSREERLLDIVLAHSKAETSLRYSLTHGGRYLPFDKRELQALRERRALAQARLELDRIMQVSAILRSIAG